MVLVVVLQVYEAMVEDKGKTFIFLRLSGQCVKELGLKADSDFSAQVCFFLLFIFELLRIIQ